MKKPTQLLELIEELGQQAPYYDKSPFPPESYAHIYLDEDCVEDQSVRLNHLECEIILKSDSTVRQMFEAIGSPPEGSILLHELEVSSQVLDALERCFIAVDDC